MIVNPNMTQLLRAVDMGRVVNTESKPVYEM